MGQRERLSFTIDDSKIAELFGQQNFSKAENAILELVKNAYDAKAKSVKIVFGADSISIVDDGEGMTIQTIKDYWMHVGKSTKINNYIINVSDNETRTLAGSKGIGRFAVARIGGRVKVFSHSFGNNPILWETDWNENYVQNLDYSIPFGTNIQISDLRDVWTEKRVNNLIAYLGKCKQYNQFDIFVEFMGNITKCSNPFLYIEVGKNCLTKFDIAYDADSQELSIDLVSDEFGDEVSEILLSDLRTKNYDIHGFKETLKVADLLSQNDYSNTELENDLPKVGNFVGTFFFNNNYSQDDALKFKYKRRKSLPSFNEKGQENGIVLYRNAFCIAGYDGGVDWLEFGKRSRSSPAAPSHPTGNWRVRENQICGEIFIDRDSNKLIEEMQNRQGITDNSYFRLFKSIVLSGIKRFENHRQTIIRAIRKLDDVPETIDSKDVDSFIKNPISFLKKSSDEVKSLAKSIVHERAFYDRKNKRLVEEINNARYDVRLLNVLATIGLKSSWKAHDLHNDKRNMLSTPGYLVDALQEFGFWSILNDFEHTKKESTNIPKMIKSIETTNVKIASFIDTTLESIEKRKFKDIVYNPTLVITDVCKRWEKEYSWITLNINSDQHDFPITADIVETVLNNLILNSVQQNNAVFSSTMPMLITINCSVINDFFEIIYRDNGKGLDKRFINNPRKILEPHETSREDGHGLGMWIVNNTILYSGGDILDISGDNGFYIRMRIGSKQYDR